MSQADFTPKPTDGTGPYWEATKERRLVLQWCPRCSRYVHHPREACPGCLGTELEWVESVGCGAVHAASVHHRPFEVMSMEDCPYVVAFIDLDEGVRFMSNIVGDDAVSVRTGDRVELVWRPVAEGYHLPVFRITASS
jgi:uncharacterized OB-fold protein